MLSVLISKKLKIGFVNNIELDPVIAKTRIMTSICQVDEIPQRCLNFSSIMQNYFF